MNTRMSKWTGYQLTGAGLLVAALGILVLVGWATHQHVLVQLIPSSTEMRRNDALGLVVCGLGMMCLTMRRSMPSLLAGAFCVLLGFLTALEWAFDLNLGIDDLLGKSYFPGQTFPPGRMSPATTLCFMLAGCALLLWRWDVGRRLRSWVPAILTPVLAAIGSVTSLGYFFRNTNAYAWGDLTRMAFNAALAFALVGIGLLILAWGEESAASPEVSGGRHLPEWLPLSAGLGVFTVTLGFWQALITEAPEQPFLSEIVLASGVVLALLLPLAIHSLQRRRGSPETTMLAAFGLAFATLIAVGIVQHRNIQALIESNNRVARAHTVLTELESAYSAVLALESDVRGYVATGDETFVSRSDIWAATAEEHIRILRDLTPDNPRQQQNLDKLEPLIRRKIDFMRRLFLVRRNQGQAAANLLIAHGEGIRLMNEIRGLTDEMKAEENGLLRTRQATGEAIDRRVDDAAAFGTLLALAFLLSAG